VSLTTVVCDLDGVVYLGRDGIEGAGEALRRLEAGGRRVVFATNNSSRTRASTAAKIISATGFPAREEQVVSSAMAAAALLEPSRPRCLVVGGDGIREALSARGVPTVDDRRLAEAVVVGFNPETCYADLRDASLAVRAGARLVATNGDATFPTAEGPWPGAGAIVAAIEVATGVAAEVAGKPHRPMGDLILAGAEEGPVWMVGDRPDTDLALAVEMGWHSVLVLTGVTRDPDEVPQGLRPDVVLGSLAELPDVLDG
jgi:HAD superfamily hydrolase (TIGR01450 family)